MRPLTIGEVCDILGLKPHILRYWEQEIPLLSPPKDGFGRREYHERELQQLFRIKYLVYTKKYTVQGVARRLLQEASGRAADHKGRVQAVRHAILNCAYRARGVSTRLAGLGVPKPMIDADIVSEASRSKLGSAAQRTLERELRRYPPRLWQDLRAVVGKGARAPHSDPVAPQRMQIISLVSRQRAAAGAEPRAAETPVQAANREDASDGAGAADASSAKLRAARKAYRFCGAAAFAGSDCVVFTPLSNARVGPESGYPPLAPFTAVRQLSMLQLIAERLLAATYAAGRHPTWVIAVPESQVAAVRAYIRGKRRFGLRKGRLVVIAQQPFPLVHPDGTAVVAADGTVPSYWSGLAGSLRLLCSTSFRRFCAERGAGRVLLVPADNPLATFPAFELLGVHLVHRNALTLEAVAARGARGARGARFRPSGAGVLELDEFAGTFTALPFDLSRIPVAGLGGDAGKADNADNDGRHGIRLRLRLSQLLHGGTRVMAVELDERAGYVPLTRAEDLLAASRALESYDRRLLEFGGCEPTEQAVEISPLFALDAETAARRMRRRPSCPSSAAQTAP